MFEGKVVRVGVCRESVSNVSPSITARENLSLSQWANARQRFSSTRSINDLLHAVQSVEFALGSSRAPTYKTHSDKHSSILITAHWTLSQSRDGAFIFSQSIVDLLAREFLWSDVQRERMTRFIKMVASDARFVWREATIINVLLDEEREIVWCVNTEIREGQQTLQWTIFI